MSEKTRTKVWKYQLDRRAFSQKVAMPLGAVILCSREQANEVCLWALVREVPIDFSQPAASRMVMEARTFLLYDTGQQLELSRGHHIYWGTVLLDGGGYVVHVFELTQGEPEVTTNARTQQFM